MAARRALIRAKNREINSRARLFPPRRRRQKHSSAPLFSPFNSAVRSLEQPPAPSRTSPHCSRTTRLAVLFAIQCAESACLFVQRRVAYGVQLQLQSEMSVVQHAFSHAPAALRIFRFAADTAPRVLELAHVSAFLRECAVEFGSADAALPGALRCEHTAGATSSCARSPRATRRAARGWVRRSWRAAAARRCPRRRWRPT
jgi:hypothetical protein